MHHLPQVVKLPGATAIVTVRLTDPPGLSAFRTYGVVLGSRTGFQPSPSTRPNPGSRETRVAPRTVQRSTTIWHCWMDVAGAASNATIWGSGTAGVVAAGAGGAAVTGAGDVAVTGAAGVDAGGGVRAGAVSAFLARSAFLTPPGAGWAAGGAAGSFTRTVTSLKADCPRGPVAANR